MNAPVISLEALRLGREALRGVSLCYGVRAVGDDVWFRGVADHVVVGLTRSTIILASVRVPDRRTSFDLVTGLSRPRNGVESAVHPRHLELLQALLGVRLPSAAVAA